MGRTSEAERRIEARYSTPCRICGEQVDEGTLVYFHIDLRQVRHTDCDPTT